MPSYDVHWQSRSTKRRAARASWRVYLWAFGIGLLAIALCWLFFVSSMMRVRTVSVEGGDRLDTARIVSVAKAEERGWFRNMLGSDHLWNWSPTLSEATKKLLPEVEAISIDRGYASRSIVVSVVEREPVGIWCFEKISRDMCQWFDGSGLAYKRAFVSSGALVPVVHDAEQDIPLDRRVLPGEMLTHFLTVLQILRERNLSVGDIQLPSLEKQEVTATTSSGQKLLFTIRTSPEHAAPVLDDFIQKGELSSLQYIDFRSSKRAFYR